MAVGRESLSNSVVALEQLKVGATTIMNGFSICRETMASFHIRKANEAMFGSARSVAEWMELVKKEN